jgi:hypothetical protein
MRDNAALTAMGVRQAKLLMRGEFGFLIYVANELQWIRQRDPTTHQERP